MWAIFAYTLYFLLGYTAIMLSCFTIHARVPTAPPILGFIARSMSAYLGLIICAVYGTIASIVLRLLNQHHAYAQWTTAKSFKHIGGAMTGVSFKFLGDGERRLQEARPAVIVGNHQTELDILMLACIWPTHCSVSAKSSLKNVPFLGWFMAISGTIFIDRADRNKAMQAFGGATKAMKDMRQSCFIFPEGTRSYSAEPTLLPFKKGAFHLAVQAQVDIMPTVVENYSKILNIKAKRFNAGTVRVKVLDPISTKGCTADDVNRLMTETREKMMAALVELSQDSDSRSVAATEAKKTS